MPLPSRIDAEQRYDKIRSLALETAQITADNKFKLTKINVEALEEALSWENSTERKYHWDWKQNYSHYLMNYPKRFEVALWENDILAAISLGRPTYNATGLRLDIVEAMPRDMGDRSTIFEEIIIAYEIYAQMINANHIRIMNPVNDAVKSYYEKYGYSYVPKGDYLMRDII